MGDFLNQTFFNERFEKGSPPKRNCNSFCLRILCYAKLHFGTAVPSPKSQKLWEDSHEVCEEKRPDKDSSDFG
jgi:hypothetical protein